MTIKPKHLALVIAGLFAVGVVVVGKVLASWKENKEEKSPEANGRLPLAPEAAPQAEEK